MPTELVERFSRKQWKDCCGKGCKKCEIAQAYIGEYGKKKGLELQNEDRVVGKKRKASKKATDEKGSGKKRSGKKDAARKAKAEAKGKPAAKAGKVASGKGAKAAKT